MEKERRELILRTIDDLALDFAAYDRKEDEELPVGSIDDAVGAGEITIDEMVERFRDSLVEHLEP